jgi:hypothetical protein
VRPLTATHPQAQPEAKSDRTPSTVPSKVMPPVDAKPAPPSERVAPPEVAPAPPQVVVPASPQVVSAGASSESFAPVSAPPTTISVVPASARPGSSAPDLARAPIPDAENGTFRPAEVDPPIVVQRRRGAGRVIAPIAIAAALVVTSVAWIRFSADAGNPSTSAREPAAKPVAAAVAPKEVAAPEPKAPEHATPPPAQTATPAPAASGASSAQPELAGAFAAALNKSETSVLVSVRTVPPAIIFESGKRLGAGTVQLNVEPPHKKRLTALLDGHVPQNFTLDGKRDSVTIMMKPVGKSSTASFPLLDGEKPANTSSNTSAPKSATAPPTAELGDPLNDVVQWRPARPPPRWNERPCRAKVRAR